MIYDLQKANVWKRISAFLFDFIVFGIVAVGIAFLISVITGYNSMLDEFKEMTLSNDVTIAEAISDGAQMSEEELAHLEKLFAELLNTNQRAAYLYTMVINLTLMIISLGILFAFLITEFIVPLLFKNGQTLGKKIFGIGVMRSDGVKMSTLMLFIRTFLGKFTIETMVPLIILLMMLTGSIGIIGPIIILLIFVLQIVMIISSKTFSPIHDVLAKTVAVDISSQMIFDTEEEMIEYKKKAHAEAVAKSDY